MRRNLEKALLYQARHLCCLVGVSLPLAGTLWAQQSAEDPRRVTLAGLKAFAVHARVQWAAKEWWFRAAATFATGLLRSSA
jgi:hypothetical protein